MRKGNKRRTHKLAAKIFYALFVMVMVIQPIGRTGILQAFASTGNEGGQNSGDHGGQNNDSHGDKGGHSDQSGKGDQSSGHDSGIGQDNSGHGSQDNGKKDDKGNNGPSGDSQDHGGGNGPKDEGNKGPDKPNNQDGQSHGDGGSDKVDSGQGGQNNDPGGHIEGDKTGDGGNGHGEGQNGGNTGDNGGDKDKNGGQGSGDNNHGGDGQGDGGQGDHQGDGEGDHQGDGGDHGDNHCDQPGDQVTTDTFSTYGSNHNDGKDGKGGDNNCPPKEEKATLKVVKHVDNSGGGTKDASDFTINVTGTDVSNPSFAGSENGTTVKLKAGSYSVDENSDANYSESLSDDCSGTIKEGEKKTCMITNTFIPKEEDHFGSITVTKYRDDDKDGSIEPGDDLLSGWVISLHHPDATADTKSTNGSGQVAFGSLTPGVYVLSENIGASVSDHDDWSLVNISCTGDSGVDSSNAHAINVNPDENITCMIGNKHTPDKSSSSDNDHHDNDHNTSGGIITTAFAAVPGGTGTGTGSGTGDANGQGEIAPNNVQGVVAGETTGSCSSWPLWVWLLALAIYGGAFNWRSFYHLPEQQHKRIAWQIAFTVGAVAFWYYYDICRIYNWFPVIAVLGGIGSLWYYFYRFSKIERPI